MGSPAALRLLKLTSVSALMLTLAAISFYGQGKGKPGPPQPPPDPAIAYVAEGALMVMNPDGTNKTTVIPAQRGIGHFDPNWSPDGTQLVFDSNIEGPGVYVINIDGTGLRKIVPLDMTNLTVAGAVWSPVSIGGQEVIVFAAGNPDHSGRYDLYAINLDGTDLVNLTNTPDIGEFNPSWNPAATRIACTGNSDLLIYDLSVEDGLLTTVGSTNLSATGPLAAYGFHRPDWARTSDRIVVVANLPSGNELLIVDLNDLGNPVFITNTSDQAENMPTWSPDDSQIAYRRLGAKGRVSIFVINADGSDAHEIGFPTSQAQQDRPDWRRNP